MGVDLGVVFRHRGVKAEGVDRPLQVGGPVGLVQRQAFAQRRLVNLDNADAGRFEIRDLVAQRQRDLLRDGFARHVLARERPAENGYRAGQHSFHRLAGQRLRIGRPLQGNRPRAADVADNHRRLDAARAVTLHPAVLGEDETLQVFAEILHHVVTLRFAVHQHVEAQTLLFGDRLFDMLRDAGAVAGAVDIAFFEIEPQAADLGGLREGADSGGRPGRQIKAAALRAGADGVSTGALGILRGDRRQTPADRRVVHAAGVGAMANWRAPGLQRGRVVMVERVA